MSRQGFRVELAPTDEQRILLGRHAGLSRLVENFALLTRVTRARGFRLTTDPGLIPLRPVPGWRVELSAEGAVTLRWPHLRPLLARAPLEPPAYWLDTAFEHGIVLVFVGHGLGLHERATDSASCVTERSIRAAENGDVVAGAVRVTEPEIVSERLGGTVRLPRRLDRP